MSKTKSSTAIDNEKKKTLNLFNALVTVFQYFFSIFYNKMTKTQIKKTKNSLYKKDISFVNIYNGLENENILPEKIPLNTPFVEKKETIIPTTLYSSVDLLRHYRLT